MRSPTKLDFPLKNIYKGEREKPLRKPAKRFICSLSRVREAKIPDFRVQMETKTRRIAREVNRTFFSVGKKN